MRTDMPISPRTLEVGNDGRDVIINHPDLQPDANGVGHIVFTPAQARNLARLLNQNADELSPPTDHDSLKHCYCSDPVGDCVNGLHCCPPPAATPDPVRPQEECREDQGHIGWLLCPTHGPEVIGEDAFAKLKYSRASSRPSIVDVTLKVSAAKPKPPRTVRDDEGPSTAEEERIEELRERIERQYAHMPLGSGAIGGTFGEILCHELHMGDDPAPAGLHFGALAYRWGVDLHTLGLLIADHCDKLPTWNPNPVPTPELG